MKVKRVSGRGTSIREEELKDQNWAGDSYRAFQEQSKAKIPKDYVIVSGRGTRRTKISEHPSPKPRPSTYGMTRVTNRGTGSRKSRNTGSKS